MSDTAMPTNDPLKPVKPAASGQPALESARALLRRVDEPTAHLWLFAATLFTSALLVFTVQPMFAKMALPRLGGSPSVWAVSMCFFQAMLLAGYCYAHALNRFLSPRLAVLVHVTVLVATLLALPIGLPQRLGEPPQGDAYIWLMGVLGLGVGLPFFAVSANAPLLQAWFAKTGHTQARDPYFLYGASNLGSLLALLAYPLVIEPAFGAQAQARLWGAGFVTLTVLIAATGALMLWLVQQLPAAEAANTDASATDASPLTWQDRALWVGLAAIPSGLMVAVTTYLTTDIASAPFMWVLPLTLFLGTFILVFKERVSPHLNALGWCLPMAVGLLAIVESRGLRMFLAIGAFFVAALICHRELYQRRPAAKHLTSFYIWMSAGGVLGGVFSALLAPQIFTSVFEFQVLLAASMLCIPGLIFRASEPLDYKRVAGLSCLTVALILLPSLAADLFGQRAQSVAYVMVMVCVGLFAILTLQWPERRVGYVLGLAALVLATPESFRPFFAERSFFGTVRVFDTGDGRHRVMLHGTTMHGARRLKTDDDVAITQPQPATYYHFSGPMARGFDVARKAKAATLPVVTGEDVPVRLLTGIVGLGTGALACYAKPGDAFRFYEIDPVVVKIATDPKVFDFLSSCTPKAPVIVGDARLTIAKEPDDVFDYLVIDAFSSDSVPVHLITVEALQLYLSKLSDTGLLALHITNRYMDLPSSVASTLRRIPGIHTAIVRHTPNADVVDASSSTVVLIGRNARVLDDVLAWPDAEGFAPSMVKAWTDDYSDVLSAVMRKWWP